MKKNFVRPRRVAAWHQSIKTMPLRVRKFPMHREMPNVCTSLKFFVWHVSMVGPRPPAHATTNKKIFFSCRSGGTNQLGPPAVFAREVNLSDRQKIFPQLCKTAVYFLFIQKHTCTRWNVVLKNHSKKP